MVAFSLPMTLTQSILWTVAYTDQFAYPLSEAEIWQRLIRLQKNSKFQAQDRNRFHQQLLRLVAQKKLLRKVSSQRGSERVQNLNQEAFFCLPTSKKNLVLRQQRDLISQQKWREVHRFVMVASRIPWIYSIWVTGSLAMRNAEEWQDIDFMIITQPKRLWLTRLLVTVLAFLVGKKRNPQGKETQTWCLNLWLDQSHITIQPQKRDLYTAYEVTQAKLVFERRNFGHSFWQANAWVSRYLPNWQPDVLTQKLDQLTYPFWPIAIFFDSLEKICFWCQLGYMRRRQTTEQVGSGFAFFHPRQTAKIVTTLWQTKISKLQ